MKENLAIKLIKMVFEEKFFPVKIIIAIPKISNLEFDSMHGDSSSGSNIIRFKYKYSWIEIAVADADDEPDFGSNIAIWTSSIDKIRDDLEMKGQFFNHRSNFDFYNSIEMASLIVRLTKFENLC